MKQALITGITGQDGSYLAEFLLAKDYKVFGLERRLSFKNRKNVEHLGDKLIFLSGDLLDHNSLIQIIQDVKLDEIYNLAAQSFVGASWNQPVYTGNVTGLGVVRMLAAIKAVNPKIKFYQASSSEMFGETDICPQNEDTPFHPRSPYGAAKLYGHWITVNYRESYDMFAVSGILFNHESPRRGLEFVTRKIVNAAVKIKLGLANELKFGNLEARRDWGFAGDYVEAMWLMLQQSKPADYVIATGENHSVKEFIESTFNYLGLDWEKYVKQDKAFVRPADINLLVGDYSKAKKELGWEPKIKFKDLIKIMIDEELKTFKL